MAHNVKTDRPACRDGRVMRYAVEHQMSRLPGLDFGNPLWLPPTAEGLAMRLSAEVA